MTDSESCSRMQPQFAWPEWFTKDRQYMYARKQGVRASIRGAGSEWIEVIRCLIALVGQSWIVTQRIGSRYVRNEDEDVDGYATLRRLRFCLDRTERDIPTVLLYSWITTGFPIPWFLFVDRLQYSVSVLSG